MVDQKEKKTRQDYKFFHEISTRWNDNDVRWHLNNAKYYEYFDTVIGKMLFGIKGLDLKDQDHGPLSDNLQAYDNLDIWDNVNGQWCLKHELA